MKIFPFQAIYPNAELITSPDSFFGMMKMEFPEFYKNGFFNRTAEEAFYVYEIQKGNRSRLGLISTTSIKDFENNKVLKHENTLAPKEQQMMHLTVQRKAMIKPVLLAYNGKKELTALLTSFKEKKPLISTRFEETNELHSVWKVSEPTDMEKIKKEFEGISKAYIADGHHRSAISVRFKQNKNSSSGLKFNNLLSVYFSFQELDIYDYNRAINILSEITPLRLMAKLSKLFKIKYLKKKRKPKAKHEIVMLIKGEYYSLKWKEDVLQKYADQKVLLDTFLLQELVLEKIMKIEDVREDRRIKYIEGTLGLEGIRDAMKSEYSWVGFAMFPVQANEIRIIADNNLTLPPKSTWFEPRIKNGLISQDLS